MSENILETTNRNPRVINYHDQLAEILTAQYNTETNFRLENDIEKDRFIFTIPRGPWSRATLDFYSADVRILCVTDLLSEKEEDRASEVSGLPQIDWAEGNRFKGKTIAQVIEKYCNSYLKKGYSSEYLNSWLNGSPEFGDGWKVKYWKKGDTKFPVAEILEDFQRKKIPFRIESVWDLGFIGVLVNKQVSPSRVQVDEYNNEHLLEDPNNLLEVPHNDWLKRFNEESLEDLVRKMNSYLKSHILLKSNK